MFKYLFSLIIAFIVLNEAYNYSSPSKITESLVSHTNDDNTQKVSFFEKENVPNDSKGYDINTLLPQNQNKSTIQTDYYVPSSTRKLLLPPSLFSYY